MPLKQGILLCMKKIFFLCLFFCVILVTQAQDKVVNIIAGGLEEALAGNYSFTTLTVSGTVDVRDFACINENASHITYIDMSGCTVAGYDSRDERFMGYHTHFEAQSIPPSAFFGFTSLERVVLPQGVQAIGDGAFAGCERLTTIEGGKYIVEIGDYAFSGCVGLSGFLFPTTLQHIGGYAFDKCSQLTKADMTACSRLGYIGKRAFAGNTSLMSVVFPTSVATIGDAAFAGCNALIDIDMPQVDSMGVGVWAACSSLQRMDMSKTELQELPMWTFSGCQSVSEIRLPKSIKSIGEGAFYYCSSLPRVELPIGLEYIDSFSFAGCDNLQSVTFIPEGVETIGRYAFYQDMAIDSVVLPASVSYIGDHAFDGCVNAASFDTPREMPAELGEMVFANMDVEHKTLRVAAESVVIYESTAQWQDFGNIVGTTGVEDITMRSDVKAVFEQYNLVVTSEQEMSDVRLYDVSGILLSRVTARAGEVVIDTHPFVANIYLLQVTTNDGRTAVTKVARVIR